MNQSSDSLSIHSSEYTPNASPVVSAVASLLSQSPQTTHHWHSSSHIPTRDFLRQHIFCLISSRRTHQSEAWRQSVAEVSSNAEERLYALAPSFEHYCDMNTLLDRLQNLVNDLVEEARRIQSNTDLLSKDSRISNHSPTCSRVFIVRVLERFRDYSRKVQRANSMTWKQELVLSWLRDAKAACCAPNTVVDEALFGGTNFVATDSSTYWTEPYQFAIWWENNVEERSMFSSMERDAKYTGKDHKLVARARWCSTILSLVNEIHAFTTLRTDGPLFPPVAQSSANYHNMDSAGIGLLPLDRLRSHADEANERHQVKKPRLRGPDTVSASFSGPSESVPNFLPCTEYTHHRQMSFPMKLHRLIENGDPSVIAWHGEGKAFRIIDVSAFVKTVLPAYFKHSNFTSFQRQLNLYRFRRTKLADKGCYYHPQFIKGRPELVTAIRRAKSNSKHEPSKLLQHQKLSCFEEPEVNVGGGIEEETDIESRDEGGSDVTSSSVEGEGEGDNDETKEPRKKRCNSLTSLRECVPKTSKVGSCYQADIPPLFRPVENSDSGDGPVHVPVEKEECVAVQHLDTSRECEMLLSSPGSIIVALLPPPNCRFGKRQVGSPNVVVGDELVREKLMEVNGTFDVYTRYRSSLAPRLCACLRLWRVDKDAHRLNNLHPTVCMRAENEDTGLDALECSLWGCTWPSDSDIADSDSDVDTEEFHACETMGSRLRKNNAIDPFLFAQVYDGVQDWMVPLWSCATTCVFEEEDIDLTTSISEHDAFRLWNVKHLTEVVRGFKRYGGNFRKVWRHLLSSSSDVGIGFKEFINFCHRVCPIRNSQPQSHGIVVASRRLINMLNRLQKTDC